MRQVITSKHREAGGGWQSCNVRQGYSVGL